MEKYSHFIIMSHYVCHFIGYTLRYITHYLCIPTPLSRSADRPVSLHFKSRFKRLRIVKLKKKYRNMEKFVAKIQLIHIFPFD
jgi:hypothetical protein